MILKPRKKDKTDKISAEMYIRQGTNIFKMLGEKILINPI